ncbi:MAG: gliding motility-associated C-terminal domain-containing protein, partial [Bacteroidales bacterium]|nr:gliding motility-associated C-terminal domain-containing protein [Bacteroidales bacterium]
YQWRKNGTAIPGAIDATFTLTNISTASAGDFDVIITGTCGTVTSTTATLTVATAPVITVQPLGTEVCERSDVSFSVTATGTDLTYQWRKNGTAIAGETLTTLSLNAVTLSDAGNYDVIVYGRCDTITSNTAILTVNPATTIISQDDDTLVCEGSTIDFSVIANGFGPITYQWQRSYYGSWIDLTDDADINGSLTNTLTIQNIEASDSGYYRCFVSSGCGAVYSDSMELGVNHIIATIGTPAPFLIDSTSTIINVGVKVTDRFLLFDLGFSLVAPDGTEVILKGPLSFPCVFNPFGNGVDVTFTTELNREDGDTIDYCWPVKVITGTYAATGDWDVLHGKDPANGAWQIRVYDADKSVPDPDGFIKLTSLSFTDEDINGDTVSVQYHSGDINIEILNPISGELRPNSYIVPIRLMTSCWDSEDARALVTVQGGIAPYTYEWTGPTVVPNSDDVLLGAGTYTVTVTDAMGCSTQATVEVSSPPPIVFDSFAATDTLNCHGDADGIIRVKASGGTGTLSYILLPGNIPSSVADSGVFTNLFAGTYTIHVEDINNCFLDSTITITEPEALAIQSITVDSLLCSGDANGRISVTAQGGKMPYTYRITPGTEVNNDGVFENLSQGNYVVRITDASLCGDTLITDTIRMDAPSPLLIDSVTVDPILCNGGSASIIIHVSGGSQPYDGSLNAGVDFTAGQLAFNDLAAGDYTPAVRDDNACITIYPSVISLVNPPPITIDSLGITDIEGCYGDTSGSIYIAASGGWNQIKYSLDGIQYQSGNLFDHLDGGPKTLYIRDSLGCTLIIDTLEVKQPSQLVVSITATHVIGSTPGTITLTASGGTPPYVYSIDNGITVQDTGYFDNLDPGLYYAFVQDANGCVFDDTVRIIINELNVSVTQDDVSCYGYGDGEFIVTSLDGTAPYRMSGSFLSPDTITSEDGFFAFIGIAAGSYDFIIEDAEGRTYADTIVINEPADITISGTVTNPTCSFNTNDGSIILNVTGGNGGYNYFWSNGSTEKDQVNLPEGLFEVDVVDANLCRKSQEFNLTGLISVSAFAGNDTTICYGSTLTLNGSGTGLDSVRWTPAGVMNNPTVTNPSVTITEQTQFVYTVYNNICWDRDTVVIDVYPLIGIDIYDPTNTFVFDTTLFLLEGQTVSLEASAGFERYLWMPDEYISDPESRSVICSPSASIQQIVFGITDAGCVETDTLHIVIAQTIREIFSGFTPNDDGYNDKWVIPHAIEYGDKIEVQVFNRWGERVFYSKGYGGTEEWDGTFKGKPLPIGTYYYIITLDDGKSDPFTGTVTIIR